MIKLTQEQLQKLDNAYDEMESNGSPAINNVRWKWKDFLYAIEYLKKINSGDYSYKYEKTNSINVFTNNTNEHVEQIESQKMEIKRLQQELEETKSKIILSEDNANRKGGKPLSLDKIQKIRELREKGFSMREVSKNLEISIGVVSKYDKR